MRAAPMLPALLRLARLQPGATPNRVRFAIAGLACFRKLPLSHSKKCAIKAILGSWVVGQDEAQAARRACRCRGRPALAARSTDDRMSPRETSVRVHVGTM